ncbi:MAG: MFS transporter [Pseudomonadota bacterium]
MSEAVLAPRVNARMLIFFGLALTAMGQTVLFAVLGPVGRDIGLSEVQVGAIISASAIMVVLASPPWGRASDRLGRKRVLVFSVAGFAVTSALFAALLGVGLAGQLQGMAAFGALIAARVTYAASIAGGQPAAAGFIADTTTPEERSGAMAIIGAAFGIGAILGPAMAFVFGGLGVLAPLFAIAGVGAVWALVMALFLREPERQGDPENQARLSPLDPRLAPLLAGTVLVFTAISMVQQTVAFYVQDLFALTAADTARRTGLLIAALAAANLAAFIAVARLKPAPHRLLIPGALVAALGIALLLVPLGLPGLFAAHILMGLGFGGFIPGAQTQGSLAVDAGQQGAVGGLVSAAMAGGFITGPLLGTALYGLTPEAAYLTAAALTALGGVLAARSRRGQLY